MDRRIIATIQGFGFDVYMRNERDTYLLFTDGTRIGYVQNSRGDGLSLSTKHMANATSGTGFKLDPPKGELTLADLERALEFAPSWATNRERSTVRKYADIEAYRAESSFNAAYMLVSKEG